MDPISNQIFGESYETPTLHVLGKTDVIVVEERSKALLRVSAHARREDHEGGLCLVCVAEDVLTLLCRPFHTTQSKLAQLLAQLSTRPSRFHSFSGIDISE